MQSMNLNTLYYRHIDHVLNGALSCEILKIRQSDWSFPLSENETSLQPRNLEQAARPYLELAEEVWSGDETTL